MTEPAAAPASEASVARGAALASAAALVVTLLMAAPVVLAPSQRLFGRGDILGRDDPNRDALIVIEQFRSGRVSAPYLQPVTDLPGRALAPLVGPVAAYNLLVLVTFPLSAAAAYLLARFVAGSHLAAMVAGLAYAFLPFHVTQAAGHPHVAQTQWLPLYFLALWRSVDRPDPPRLALLLASAAAVALSNFYGGLIAATLGPVALVAYAVVSPRPPDKPTWRGLILTAVALVGAGVAALILIRVFAPAVLMAPEALSFPRAELFAWSARWWSYLVPPADHPLVGPAVREFWARRGVGESLLEHQQVSVGWSLLVLAAVPLVSWLRGDRSALAVRSAPVLAILAAAAVICSLSPERTIGALTFARPSALLYEVAPMFRAYSRFGVVVGLMTSLLAGAGAAHLWRRPGSAGRRVAVVLLALAAIELAPFPPWRWRDVLPTHAHRWLASREGPARVLDCASGLADCGEPRLGEKLKAMGYTHVVVRRDSATGRWLAGHLALEGLARGPEFDDSRILEVSAELPRAYVRALLGFHPREYEGKDTWRWMRQTGALTIVATREPVDAGLDLELRAFPGDRRIEWFLDGRRGGELQVASGWRRYELRLGTLGPGEHTVTLACESPALVASDVLHNGDPRALAVALGDWSLGVQK